MISRTSLVSALGLATLLACAGCGSSSAPPRQSVPATRGDVGPQAVSCQNEPSMELAVIGRLNAGYELSTLTSEGFNVAAAIQSNGQIPQSSLFVVYTQDPSGSVQALRPNLAVATAGLLLAQSSNPAYFTCDHTLSDSSGAHAMLVAAQRALISGGYATSAQLSSAGTTYLISDDPTQTNSEIVTAELNTPVTTQQLIALNTPDNPLWDAYYNYLDTGQVSPPGAAPPTPPSTALVSPPTPPGSTTMLVAEVSNAGTVLAVGFGAWCAASPQQPAGP